MKQSSEEYFGELAESRGGAEVYHAELAKADMTAAPHRVAVKAADEPDLANEPEGQLTIDVYQTSSEIVIESAVAGVNPEDLDITITPDSVAIKGHRRREQRVKDEDYIYQECYWGRFARSVILPQEIDPESSHATFKNGILTVHLPKLNKKKTRKLKVKFE